MDYLNLVSTRSIILFAPPSPSLRTTKGSVHDAEFASPPGSPTTPTSMGMARLSLSQSPPLPAPISIPLDSFLSGGRAESDLAYFLIRHILAGWAKHTHRASDSGSTVTSGSADTVRAGADGHEHGFGGAQVFDDTCTFGGGAGIGTQHRDRTKEAEELAWIEIYKAKTFVMRLGEKWAAGKVGEKEMRGMAKALGLALKDRRGVEA